ncbi:type II secretion system protein [Thermobrachium celere]|uniref:type II secretion system protein n=1 Tax=Thermobrachium celere TaxID=53422 RepID=UPI001944951D|nr:prepilin-type N-terminal cleavage/methylation domain-containing protein [Thermobrachium celere]GFR36408.1 hypothetical protein TCEA9_22200 [Thermobrachium celere]
MIKKGFTLIEVLLGIFIITILIPAFIDVDKVNIFMAKESENSYKMFLIASSICELYKNSSYYYEELSCQIYLNSSNELDQSIEMSLDKLRDDTNKRYKASLNFKLQDTGLYKLKVEVEDLLQGEKISLSCYK